MLQHSVIRRRTVENSWLPSEGNGITHSRAMQIIELEHDDWNFFCWLNWIFFNRY